MKQLVIVLLAGVMGLNGYYSLVSWQRIKRAEYDYQAYSQWVVKAIPTESRVFLSATPDPYFGLANAEHNYRLYEFPAVSISQERYRRVLSTMDYVVFTHVHNRYSSGSFLEEYLGENAKEVRVVRGGGYEAKVFRLR